MLRVTLVAKRELEQYLEQEVYELQKNLDDAEAEKEEELQGLFSGGWSAFLGPDDGPYEEDYWA
ncbi:uncharacterized protein Z518_03549 [Rhinocladiella mackenziei CBS 650.93]|uniref:Uncharacterized protein n=1 Tax=Rhinocladiella mackenziei CBS 650.93 TaxID=1442369 RepID=A0A0D2G2W7_9EURO|nr:uncharacterized protein Z518_03549 [Rhinocladiella mackenziei CBS 650.93]KIX08892.1 hypothetical protein Z518_03549 [Rhinocladiella mackenziei CBS 650.93]